MNYKSELVGVFGYPVAENPTIIMQEAAFKALNLNFRYLTVEVRPEDLAAAMAGLKAMNMRGINLTIPHKVEVLKYLDEISEAARLMGAVNTVTYENGKLLGENTDGKGFIRSMTEDAGLDLKGKNVVVFGAGGASRAICVELALAGVKQLTLVNKSAENGLALQKLLVEKCQAAVNFILLDQPYSLPASTDILVNATSVGLFPDIGQTINLDFASIQPGLVVCDVIPNPPDTLFLREARARGARTFNGLGMLVNQGAIGFKLWTGQDAPLEVMKAALEKEFSNADG